MKSKTSFFNKMIFWKDITRFWLLWTLQLAAGFFMMIAPLLSQLSYADKHHEDCASIAAETIQLSCLSPYIMVLCVLVAVSVFLYLTREREAYTIHSFPMKRTQIFASHYLAGITMIVVPVLLTYAGILIVISAYGVGKVILLVGSCVLEWLIQVFFFYNLACVVIMLTGNAFMNLVIYGVLNFLAAGVVLLYNMLADLFVYGNHGFSLYSVMENCFVKVCTPVVFFMEHTFWEDGNDLYYKMGKNVKYMFYWTEVGKTAVYLIPAVLLLLLAVFLYRIRQLEAAGDMIAFSWGRPVFRIVFVFCSSLLFTAGVYAITFANTVNSYAYAKIFRILLVFVVIGTILFYLISNMILDKTFFIWKKTSYWRMALFAVLMTLSVTAVRNGQMGSGLPDRNKIQKVGVQIQYHNEEDYYDKPVFYLTDVKDIQKIYRLNREILKYGRNMNVEENTDMDYIEVKYYLSGEESRTFSYPVLAKADITKKLNRFIQSRPDVCEMLYGKGYETKLQRALYISCLTPATYGEDDDTYSTISESDITYLTEENTEDQELRNELYRAVIKDIREGNTDVFREQNVTSFRVGVIDNDSEEQSQGVQITKKCTNTMPVLEKLGLVKNDNGRWEMIQGK